MRTQVYDKLVRLGTAYTESASTAEAVQVCVEGTEQLEGYFGAYVPQLFYAVLAPLTLFACLAPLCLPAAVALLLCVPLIPASIAAVQKIVKRVMGEYWGAYTDLGATFLENLQGLTTLKIFQADEVALVCRGVGYTYDGKRAVLQDVNFEAPAGSFSGIVGESGSGKSTLAGITNAAGFPGVRRCARA
ncbi:ABC transporter transmembrane domain-containing protein [Adlercreutzia sp. CNCM I-6216]